MDGVFHFYLVLLASEHLISGFSLKNILTSERISGRHALRNLLKDNFNDLAVFRFAGSRFGRPAFHGDTELRARQLFLLLRCFTRGAGTPPSILAFVRLDICPFLNPDFLLARIRKDGMGMVMRAHAEMFLIVTNRTGHDIYERHLSFFA